MSDFFITALMTIIVLFMVLNLAALFAGWVDRKASALMQDRIGANRASLVGILPINLGLTNAMLCDPLKFFTKEDCVPPGADKLLHTLAPLVAFVPALVSFIVIPFGDVLVVGGREIRLQAANLNVGILYILGMVSLGVYGVVLAGWASNNRWALLGGSGGQVTGIKMRTVRGSDVKLLNDRCLCCPPSRLCHAVDRQHSTLYLPLTGTLFARMYSSATVSDLHGCQ